MSSSAALLGRLRKPCSVVFVGSVASLLLVGLMACGTPPVEPIDKGPGYKSQAGWVSSPTDAIKQIAAGALVLDVRRQQAFAAGHVPGAQNISMTQLREPLHPDYGLILKDRQLLTSRLQALGISAKRSILVVGDPKAGFGETGRLVWLLRTLGHPDVAFVDGGIVALQAFGQKLTQAESPPAKGDFVIQRDTAWDISRAALIPVVADSKRKFRLIDARSKVEFDGTILYGEARPGHLPDAVSLHYKDLQNEHGQLKTREAILAMLKAQGITPETPVIAYCTAGVRAAFLSVVLVDLGFTYLKHYAGSMLEWSNQPAANHPMVK